MKIVLLVFLVIFLGFIYGKPSRDRNTKPYRVICYWGTWSFYRPGDGKFQADDIDPSLCTHLVYAFAKLEDNAIAIFDPNLDIGSTDSRVSDVWGHGMYKKFNALRQKNPQLSTMIAIGGWNEGSDKYSQMASTRASRAVFIKSVLAFLGEHNFDGLDLDWEYPSKSAASGVDRTAGNAEDKENFIELIRELHKAFAPHGYILSAAVSAGKATIDTAYDVQQMSRYLDFCNIMLYDFTGSWQSKTGHHSPLIAPLGSSNKDIELTVSFAIDYWISLGLDPAKLVVGIPFYGRSFTLAGKEKGLGAPTKGAGKAGPFTRQEGTLGYNEICILLKKSGWSSRFDTNQQIPYATKDDQWIGYDSQKSIELKLKFMAKRNLRSVMVWSLETDDFKGNSCGNGKYPLLRTINHFLSQGTTQLGESEAPQSPTEVSETSEVSMGSTAFTNLGTAIFVNILVSLWFVICN